MSEPTEPIRPLRRAMWLMSAAFLVVGTIAVYLAPVGYWVNYVGAVKMWDNSDPGGPYVVSSLYFFHVDKPLPFVGHPGMLLQMLIGTLASIGYGAARLFGGGEHGYFAFWATHFRWIFILSGWLTVVLHVLSFWVVEAFARRMLGAAKPAFWAAAAYATLFPVMYYLPRVSVEPILVSATLLAFMAAWSSGEALETGNSRRAMWLAAAAGAMAALALFNKIQLAFALVPFVLLVVLGQRWRTTRLGRRGLAAAAFLAGAVVVAAPLAARVDWQDFFDKWTKYAPGNTKATRVDDPHASAVGRTAAGVIKALEQNLRKYNPWPPKGVEAAEECVFTRTEFLFVPVSLAGLVILWRTRRPVRGPLMWMLGYLVLLTPVVVYRGAWHYLFVHFPLMAVCFAAALRAVLKDRPAWLGAAAVIAIHGFGIFWVIESFSRNVGRYVYNIQPIVRAVEKTDYDRRIILVASPSSLWTIHGAYLFWTGTATEFLREFDHKFKCVDDLSKVTPELIEQEDAQWVLAPRRKQPAAMLPARPWPPPSGKKRQP